MDMFRIMILTRMPCLFHELTGLYCPGCGGTRAVRALLKGHPLISFCYHPLVLYCALVGIWFVISNLIWKKTGNPRYRMGITNRYVYVGIALIVINFFVKNFMILVMGIDPLALLPEI